MHTLSPVVPTMQRWFNTAKIDPSNHHVHWLKEKKMKQMGIHQMAQTLKILTIKTSASVEKKKNFTHCFQARRLSSQSCYVTGSRQPNYIFAVCLWPLGQNNSCCCRVSLEPWGSWCSAWRGRRGCGRAALKFQLCPHRLPPTHLGCLSFFCTMVGSGRPLSPELPVPVRTSKTGGKMGLTATFVFGAWSFFF